MPKRIPPTDFEVLTGKNTAEEYLAMQKRLGKFYLKGFLKELMAQNRKGKYLEIGPGPGFQTAIIAEKNPESEITAVELSADMIHIATKYITEKGLSNKVQFVEGSVEDESLIQKLGKFDLIYTTFSMHHWKNPVTSIRILYNALRDDGLLFIYDFERNWLAYLPLERGIRESIRASYTPKEIESMMKELQVENYQIKKRFPYIALFVKK
jgi:predicted O-methyltransferase YrrM